MVVADSPQTRVRSFVGETPRPRIPQSLTSIVGIKGLQSVSRSRQAPADSTSRTARRQIDGSTSSTIRQPYGTVPRWPYSSEDVDGTTSGRAELPTATPIHGENMGMRQTQPQYDPKPSVRQHLDHMSTPMYPRAQLPQSNIKSYGAATMSNHDHAGASAVREASTSRVFMDDHVAMTTSSMLKSGSQSQEIVLFVLHPQTIIRPLRRAVRQVFTGLLEWLLDVLKRRGMPRNIALARLNATRWFARLFDYVAIERMLNIFKLYLNQSDALAVPRDFVDVYDAFSHEINRYCLSESMRTNMVESHGNRAFVVGGIDFTEETLKSMTRSIDPWQQHAYQTPLMPPQLIISGGPVAGTTGTMGISSPGQLMEPVHNAATATSSVAEVNRGYLLNKDNLAMMSTLVARLQSILNQKKKELERLRREQSVVDAKLHERKRVLLEICVGLTNKRLLADSLDFKATFMGIQQQFDISRNIHSPAKQLAEINRHMHAISKCAASLSKM